MDKPTLPPALASDPRFAALCDILWEQTAQLPIEQILLYLIDTAPEIALPHLAEQFSLTEEILWPQTSTSATKRYLIQKSIELHRLKGTPWAVKAALGMLGGTSEMIEWFAQSPPGQPYTFVVEHLPDITPNSLVLTDTWFDRIIEIVHSVKSARSHLAAVRLVLANDPAPVYLGAITAVADTIDLYPYQPDALEYPTPLFAAVGTVSHEIIEITPMEAS